MDQNMQQPHNKTHIIRALIIVALFVMALIFLWNNKQVPSQNEPAPVRQESVLSVKTIKESTDYTDINVQIPQFKNASKEFNAQIENDILDLIESHKIEVADNWRARVETSNPDYPLPEKPINPGDRMYFFAKFDAPEQNNSNYISVLVHFGGYTGGAHGYEESVTYNYDVKNKREVSLAQVLGNDPDYLLKISNIAREELVKKITQTIGDTNQQQTNANYLQNIKDLIYTGTQPDDLNNFSKFTFTSSELTIYFSPYQVAPYAFGAQSVKIPLPLN